MELAVSFVAHGVGYQLFPIYHLSGNWGFRELTVLDTFLGLLVNSNARNSLVALLLREVSLMSLIQIS